MGWRYRWGRNLYFAPPSEWRPRRPPIPPVGKTAPAHTHMHNRGLLHMRWHSHTKKAQVIIFFFFSLHSYSAPTGMFSLKQCQAFHSRLNKQFNKKKLWKSDLKERDEGLRCVSDYTGGRRQRTPNALWPRSHPGTRAHNDSFDVQMIKHHGVLAHIAYTYSINCHESQPLKKEEARPQLEAKGLSGLFFSFYQDP